MADDDDWESAWDSGVPSTLYLHFRKITNKGLGRRSPPCRRNKQRSRKNKKEE